jgi:hypothetical protein
MDVSTPAYLHTIGDHRLTLQADIFNIFDPRKEIEFTEIRDYSRADSLAAGPRPGTPFAPGTLNPNYGNPTSYQSRRSVRFTARYEF